MNVPALTTLSVVHLHCVLSHEEDHCLAELLNVQRAQTMADLTPSMREGLIRRESALVREVNQLRRSRLFSPNRLVALVDGGQA